MKRASHCILATAMLLAAVFPATAGVTVGFDVETLNELLPALSASEIVVPITDSRSVSMFLERMRVTGLEPSAGEDGSGHILTSMRVRIPQLGINLPVQPRISLHVSDEQAASLLELRFEEVTFSLPLAGSVNVARLLPPLRYPMDNVWLLAGTRGDVPISSRLRKVEMGRKAVRFVFEVEVQSP